MRDGARKQLLTQPSALGRDAARRLTVASQARVFCRVTGAVAQASALNSNDICGQITKKMTLLYVYNMIISRAV